MKMLGLLCAACVFILVVLPRLDLPFMAPFLLLVLSIFLLVGIGAIQIAKEAKEPYAKGRRDWSSSLAPKVSYCCPP